MYRGLTFDSDEAAVQYESSCCDNIGQHIESYTESLDCALKFAHLGSLKAAIPINPLYRHLHTLGYYQETKRRTGVVVIAVGFACIPVHKWAGTLIEEAEVWIRGHAERCTVAQDVGQVVEHVGGSLPESDVQKLVDAVDRAEGLSLIHI